MPDNMCLLARRRSRRRRSRRKIYSKLTQST